MSHRSEGSIASTNGNDIRPPGPPASLCQLDWPGSLCWSPPRTATLMQPRHAHPGAPSVPMRLLKEIASIAMREVSYQASSKFGIVMQSTGQLRFQGLFRSQHCLLCVLLRQCVSGPAIKRAQAIPVWQQEQRCRCGPLQARSPARPVWPAMPEAAQCQINIHENIY